MLIGGVAVIAHGVRRLTDDVDAALWAKGVDLERLLARLEKERVLPRRPDALAFAQRSQVLLLRHEPSGTDIDLSLAWLSFESEALDRAEEVKIGRRRVRVATPGDLVVYKAIAARERDLSDLEQLLSIHGARMDLPRARRLVKELAGVLERPELVQSLDRIIQAVKGRRRPRRPAKKR